MPDFPELELLLSPHLGGGPHPHLSPDELLDELLPDFPELELLLESPHLGGGPHPHLSGDELLLDLPDLPEPDLPDLPELEESSSHPPQPLSHAGPTAQ